MVGLLEVSAQACLGELADDALSAMLVQSKERSPDVEKVCVGLVLENREKVVAWLVSAFVATVFRSRGFLCSYVPRGGPPGGGRSVHRWTPRRSC